MTEPSPAAVAQASLALKPSNGRSSPEIIQRRFSYHATNYFTLYNMIGPIQEGFQQHKALSEILDKPMADVLKRAGREAAREIALRSMRVDDLLEAVFPDRLSDAIYYSLLDRIDVGKLRDPFNPSEGVPGVERGEPERFPRHANLQLHPFRTDPSIDATLHTSAIDFGVRASVKEAGIVTQIPLTETWVLTQGIKCEDYDRSMVHASFGVSKVIRNGYFMAGIRLPAVSNASPENRMQFIVAFQKRF